MVDGWDSKHRSWRLKVKGVTPATAWPVSSLGRRLAEERPGGVSAEDDGVHEFQFPNGSKFWVVEPQETVSLASQMVESDAANVTNATNWR